MTAASVAEAEVQWRAQVAAMRAAIAELKLPAHAPNGDSYVEEDDDDFDYSSGSGGHDLWDYISDSELDEIGFDSGDLTDAVDGVNGDTPYGLTWFASKCSTIAARKNGLSAEAFQDQIAAALASNQQEDELQSLLTDIVGFDDLDFIIELISHRKEIAASLSKSDAAVQPAGTRLLSKAQREEALRREDYKHKHAALASASAKEPVYPHVYTAYKAGNTLSYAGKKYSLPEGSQRLEREKYEEYSVPAGKPGVLGPGRQLIKIKDLDGLCRRTFKGYKTLNRMQSLVYPVAYKTSENMLICAPTGAVRILYVRSSMDEPKADLFAG